MRISDWSSDVCSSDLAVDVHARDPMGGDERLCTHCVIVFVALDEAEGNPIEVPTWVPRTDDARRLSEYATQVMALSKGIAKTGARHRDEQPFRPRAGNDDSPLRGTPSFASGGRRP